VWCICSFPLAFGQKGGEQLALFIEAQRYYFNDDFGAHPKITDVRVSLSKKQFDTKLQTLTFLIEFSPPTQELSVNITVVNGIVGSNSYYINHETLKKMSPVWSNTNTEDVVDTVFVPYSERTDVDCRRFVCYRSASDDDESMDLVEVANVCDESNRYNFG
jgi:hypothetical protein